MEASKTVDEFCAAEKICRASFYNLLKRGKGPTVMRIGNAVRITPEAHAEWRRKMESTTEPAAA